MCGGDLLITDETGIATCEYCGSTQTVPKDNDDKRTNLFNRANRLRIANEFDKAAGIYESIIVDFPEESEAYWGICLCKYGIEYVDDPITAKKIPTCHRTVLKSIFKDADFEQALENADEDRRTIYRSEAKEIDRIQKSIISIAQHENPYDIFICYKENDNNGNRTKESVIGQDLYDALTAKGYKVFFARISLEDKLGQEYEPYIFSALASAKIMLVIGTSYENLNAVWVKNEWARFLDMMRSDKTKLLIPCYMGIDAYDMPDEFKNLQGQDLSKLGAKQDIVRGICKILDHKTEPVNAGGTTTVSAPDSGSEIKKYMERADIALDNHQWKEADGFFEKILGINPKNAYAYVGKLMAEQRVSELEDLKALEIDIENNNNFKNAMRFADDRLTGQLNNIKNTVNNSRYQKVQIRKKRIKIGVITGAVIATVCITVIALYRLVVEPKKMYERACILMNNGDYDQAIDIFSELGGYRDSAEKEEECSNSLENRETLKNAKKGDVIKFGNYNGNTDWLVLDRVDNRIFVLSKTCICEKKWNDTETEELVGWDNSTIRNWLNGEYINRTFTDTEIERILFTEVSNKKYYFDKFGYIKSDDDPVSDRIILLSKEELDKYLPDKNERIADEKAWWLFTNGSKYRSKIIDIYYVRQNGTLFETIQNAGGIYVRPAMWIDISEL